MDLSHRKIFEAGSNIPVIAPVIDKAAGAIIVDLIFHGEVEFGTGAQDLRKNVVTVWRVVVEGDWARTPPAMGFGEFKNGVADLKFGVGDQAGVVFVFLYNF